MIGVIIRVFTSLKPFYASCRTCLKKLNRLDASHDTYICPKCHMETSPATTRFRYTMRVSIARSMHQRLLNVSVFGDSLDELFGISASKLYKYIASKSETQDASTERAIYADINNALSHICEGQWVKVEMQNASLQPNESIIAKRLKFLFPTRMTVYQAIHKIYSSKSRYYTIERPLSRSSVHSDQDLLDSAYSQLVEAITTLKLCNSVEIDAFIENSDLDSDYSGDIQIQREPMQYSSATEFHQPPTFTNNELQVLTQVTRKPLQDTTIL